MRIERIDDLGILIGTVRRSGLPEVLDSHYPQHHNWEGPSLGKIVCGWLGYLLSEADHRLSHMEDWASERLGTLRLLLDAPDLEARHFRDQHLEVILDRFSDRDRWSEMLCCHVGHLLEVYPLDNDIIRLDAMITQSYRDIGGLFQIGYSKQHAEGLPQIKEMMALADSFALPLAVEIVSGDRADDQLYLPVVERVRKAVAPSGLLYAGDSKMGSLATRRTLEQQGNGYLCPLGLSQFSEALREEALAAGPARARMEEAWGESGTGAKARRELKACGFAFERTLEGTDGQGRSCQWKEKIFMVCSAAHQQAQARKLEERLARAEEELGRLLEPRKGRRAIRTREELDAAAARVLQRNGAEGLLETDIEEHSEARTDEERQKNPRRREAARTFSLSFRRSQAAIESRSRLDGWQAYATNRLEMTFSEAVSIYRRQYRIEHAFDKLLNRTLHLLPVYLQLEKRICALIRLLMLALQFSAIIEHQVRTALKDHPGISQLKGLYPGHKGRATRKPTASMILSAFRNISVVFNPAMPPNQQIQIHGWKDLHLTLLNLASVDLFYYTLQPATPNLIPER
nr:IS1634 family transposase [Bacteroidia bacterium]